LALLKVLLTVPWKGFWRVIQLEVHWVSPLGCKMAQQVADWASKSVDWAAATAGKWDQTGLQWVPKWGEWGPATVARWEHALERLLAPHSVDDWAALMAQGWETQSSRLINSQATLLQIRPRSRGCSRCQ